jgi:GNAT superfamily N-acetyltransferase
METSEFAIADLQLNRDQLVALNIEYMEWVFAGINDTFSVDFEALIGISAKDYIPRVIDEICGKLPPEGNFYLVKVAGKVAGMGGLCRVNDRDCEVKRLYIRKDFRGNNLGEELLHRLLEDAQQFGYRKVVLNTALFMKSAHRIYERNGFQDCPAYEGSEVPPDFLDRWRFMQRPL